MNNWQAIWQKKGLQPAGSDVLKTLMNMDGFDTSLSEVTTQDFRAFADRVADVLELDPRESYYEVGCGAGAFLHCLRDRIARAGGIDYADSLIAVARRHVASDDLTVGEAAALPLVPEYDAVVAAGCFMYFPDLEYAAAVLNRMMRKARRVFGATDVNDLARKEDMLTIRRAKLSPGEYERRYEGLEQLFIARAWFEDFARRHDLRCIFTKHPMPNYFYVNYRYNVYFFKT